MAKAEKEILAGLDNELKKAGVKKGTKRGSYKKKNNLIDNSIVEIIEENKPELTHNEFRDNIEFEKIEPLNDPRPENIGDVSFKNTNTEEVKEEVKETNFDSGEKSLSDFINANKSQGEYKEVQLSSIKPNTEYKETNKQISNEMKKLINGRMLLNMCNVVFPTLIKKIGGMFNDEIRTLDKQKLKLTKDQIDDLKECADEVAAYVFSQVNPITAFFIMLSMSYYGNLSDALSQQKLNSNAI